MKQLLTVVLIMAALNSEAQHTIIVKHTYYTLEYDTVLKSPLISWYIQTTAHATSINKIDRKTVASFHQDPLIPTKYQCANDIEYLNNGKYDKGHLSPYSAFYFDLTAAKESMYYTNTSPQYSFFNEHSWEKLEQYVLKTLSPTIDSIYVYTGVLYSTNKMNDVLIGDYYWKVIIYKNNLDCWIAPNIKTELTDYTTYHTDMNSLKKKILNYYPKLQLSF